MHKKTVTELAFLLNSGQVSSVELTEHYLERIRRYNERLNSFITVDEAEALKAAALADAKRRNKTASFLTGVPIALKDIFCMKGQRTTCGSRMLENFISPYDSTLVTRLKNEGVVILGKTNMDEFAMGSSNENSYFGPCKNPWDLTRVPGGSSGGSAAAVAARLAPAATGTDTGGSIRQPAALTGLTGLKPTYGRVSRFGMIAYASSLDQGGWLGQTAEDIAHLLQIISGYDPHDSTSIDKHVPDFSKTLNDDLAGIRIGLPKEYFGAGLDKTIATKIQEACRCYEKLGATICEVSLPRSDLSLPVYYIVAPAECSANLARYDGVRYGYRCENPKNLRDMYCRSRGEGFGREVIRRIMIGTYVLSSGYYDAYYRKAQQVRRLIRDDFMAAFEQVDVLLSPTSYTTAFRLGEKSADPIAMYYSDINTVAVNLAGLPALSMPVGFSEGLPIGMQLIGNSFEEAKLLNIAHRYQQETDFHRQMPLAFNE